MAELIGSLKLGNVSYLVMRKVGREVEAGSAHPVRDVDVRHGRDQEPHAGHGVVGGRHVRRRLPVLVPSILCSAVREQHLDALLKLI